MRWSDVAKVLCILHHGGVQLILAYSWARPAILEAGKGRRGNAFIMSPPPPSSTHQRGKGTYCFWDGSRWPWRRHKTSCLFCNSNTLWNISMILGRNVEQRVAYKNDNSAFLLLALSPFVMSDSNYPLISYTLCKSNPFGIFL